MAITKFEVGKWYVYKGEKGFNWNGLGEMDGILDRKPHKCVKADDMCMGGFEDIGDGYMWCWLCDMDGFEEVPAPFIPKKGERILVSYNGNEDTWIERTFVRMSGEHYMCLIGGNEDFLGTAFEDGKSLCWSYAKPVEEPVQHVYKRGDEVLVWDGEVVDESQKKRRIYISTIEGANCPYHVVSYNYKNGKRFNTTGYEHIEPAPPKKPAREKVDIHVESDGKGGFVMVTSDDKELNVDRGYIAVDLSWAGKVYADVRMRVECRGSN